MAEQFLSVCLQGYEAGTKNGSVFCWLPPTKTPVISLLRRGKRVAWSEKVCRGIPADLQTGKGVLASMVRGKKRLQGKGRSFCPNGKGG